MPIKTLVVDSSPSVRRLLRYRLTACGCDRFSETASAAQALAKLRAEKYDLVTLDLLTPPSEGIGGEQAFQKIRADFPDTAVIITSPVTHDAVRADYLKRGALGYLVKPLTAPTFETARSLIRRRFGTGSK